MDRRLQVKDIPNYGISIVTSLDPSFDKLMSAFLQDQPPELGEALKPFSVFLRNTSNRIIVAYSIKWELTTAEGRVKVRTECFASTWLLMSDAGPNLNALIAADDIIIRPSMAKFLSLTRIPDILPKRGRTGVGGFAFSFRDPNNAEGFQRARQLHDPVKQVKVLNRELSQYATITVLVDGAFFEDGSFVGPNTTDFFGQIKVEIDAQARHRARDRYRSQSCEIGR